MYLLVKAKEMNGEFEYNLKIPVSMIEEEDNSVNLFCAKMCRERYTDFSHTENGSEYHFHCGVSVRYEGYAVLSEAEYEVLKKYL